MKRFIKSGTCNYGRSYVGEHNEYGFPSAYFETVAYFYDEETDTESDEIDYDLTNVLYDEAVQDARRLANDYDVDVIDDRYSSSDPFYLTIESGYYDGMQIVVHDGEEDDYNDDYGNDADSYLQRDECFEKICDFINALKDYGWEVYA